MMTSVPARILVVDDDRGNRLLLERGLVRRGWEVMEAASGAEALGLLGPTLRQPPHEPPGPEGVDLVLLDIMMPGMDGGEVLRELRRAKSRAELPVIMITARDTPEDVVEALEAGANDYIAKPVNLQVLCARVGTHLALRASHCALKQAHQSLVQAARMESVGYLAAGVAHQIRNPLARIRLAAQSLARHAAVGPDEKLGRGVASLEAAVVEADAVVQRLMKFSRREGLELRPVDLHGLLGRALAALEGEIAAAGVEVVTDLAGELPAVLVAEPEMVQVLLRLLMNGIEAAGGGGTVEVRTSVACAGDVPAAEGEPRPVNRIRSGEEVVCLEIRDTGPGLSEEELGRVFDPFYTTKFTGAATGMGLTVARKLVDLHGGILTVANRRDGPGVLVTVLLRQAGAFRTPA